MVVGALSLSVETCTSNTLSAPTALPRSTRMQYFGESRRKVLRISTLILTKELPNSAGKVDRHLAASDRAQPGLIGPRGRHRPPCGTRESMQCPGRKAAERRKSVQ